jgi:Zn-dependent M28 family amino/carboxypeptidase
MAVVLRLRGWHAPVTLCLVALVAFSARSSEPNSSEERMRRDITFLASDECEGRGVTTQGIRLAGDYVAREFQKAGLKPGGKDGSYFQPFTISGVAQLGSPNGLVLRGPQGQEIELKSPQQFQPLGMSPSGEVTAPVIFAGYGVTADGYDDYAGLDVEGKVVLLLRKTPRPDNRLTPFGGATGGTHAPLTAKATNAVNHKAAALIFVNDYETAKADDPLMSFDYSLNAGRSKVPAVHLLRSVADELLRSALGARLRDLEADIDRETKPRSAALAGWTAHVQVTVERAGVEARNVIGVLEGEGPKANETVVVGAHYDHLGYGGFGSLARGLTGPAIHHGADDNGSGTTAVLELARRFAALPKRDRRLVFMTFSGEERGLLGSAHYCGNPIYPLADTVAMVNLDMVGRLRPDPDSKKDKLIVYGTGSAKDFDTLVDTLNQKYDFKFQKNPSGLGPSDQMSFYLKSIPVLFFFTGDHPDYHRPSDTSDKINIPGMRKVTDLAEDVIAHLLTRPERPEFVKVADKGSRQSPGVSGPRLGIRPAYDDEKDGVLLEGVSKDGPAEKAGLKAGDRIVEIGGKEVKNLEAYMSLLAGKSKGAALEIGIMRDGKKVVIKVMPE